MSFLPEVRRRLRGGFFALIVPVGMSDEHGPGDWTGVSGKVGYFHPPQAKWLPHVTPARRDMTYSADLSDKGIDRPDVVSDRPPD